MPIRTDLTDTLLAMIPEDGRRMGNDEIRAALEREAEEPFSDSALEKAKNHVVAIGEAEEARGPGGGLKKRGMSAPPRAAVASAPQIAIATGTTAASVLTCLLSICRLDELEALERAALEALQGVGRSRLDVPAGG